MAGRGSPEGGGVELLVLLPDGRSVTHVVAASCPMMDLLIQIASKENLKPSAYAIEAVDSAEDRDDHGARPTIAYKPNTPVGQLATQVIRLAAKNSTAAKMAPPTSNGSKARENRISYSESFSNRVQNFNKMSGVSAVEICNDPDGFSKLSEDTKRIKSRSNFITSTLPPQVSSDSNATSFMNTFRLQIHLPCEQLHVIRASQEYAVQDILDILHEERGLRLERYSVHKTNEPDIILDYKSTLKEYGITEMTLKLLPEFEIKRSVHPKKVKKENSSHFRSAFKSFFQQLKPTSRSNSISELRVASETPRPKSEPPRINTELSTRLAAQPRPPPRKRGQAPPPPVQGALHSTHSTHSTTRSHTASESSCESAGDSGAGGSAPATLPRRCRLAPESASTTDLAADTPMPPLRRGVSDMAVNKPRFARRKRAAPRPPAPISGEELAEDGAEELVAQMKIEPPLNLVNSSHKTTEFDKKCLGGSGSNEEDHHDQADYKENKTQIEDKIVSADSSIEELTEEQVLDHFEEQLVHEENKLICENGVLVHDDVTNKEVISTQHDYRPVYNEDSSILNVNESIIIGDRLALNIEPTTHIEDKEVSRENKSKEVHVQTVGNRSFDKEIISNSERVFIENEKTIMPEDNNELRPNGNDIHTIHNFEGFLENKNRLVLDKNQTVHNIASSVNYKEQSNHAEEQLVDKEDRPVKALTNNAPTASQSASFHQVDQPVEVDTPVLKVVPTPKTVEVINSHSHIVTPTLSKLDNHRSMKPLPEPKIASSSTSVSKPTVNDLLSQIQKMKQNKQLKRSQSNIIEKYGSTLFSESYEKRQTAIETTNHIENDTMIHNPGVHSSSSQHKFNATVVEPKLTEQFPSQGPLVIDLHDTQFRHTTSNGTIEEKNIESSQLASEAVITQSAIEKQIYDPGARSTQMPKFMLTSWVEEKRNPIVNRIADYGSKNSSTQVSGASAERALASALAATLPRPFTRPHSEISTNFTKPTTVNTLPTIINVVEKVKHSKVDAPPNTTERTSAYTKLNLYNMSPTILPDPRLDLYANGESDANIPTKPSWELVQDASKKLAENKITTEKVEIKGKVQKPAIENGSSKEAAVRHVYKYPKPLQFQLGTWTDKTKTLKIEPEGNLGHKEDPPLVTELDEVAVWSATY